jgi:putative ABC transport system ATP-binding protein
MAVTIESPIKDIQQAPAARTVDPVKTDGTWDAGVSALARVEVEFAPGQFLAVEGPSESGRSTHMHRMAGLDVVTSGHAFFVDGQDIAQLDDAGLTGLLADPVPPLTRVRAVQRHRARTPGHATP